MGPKMCPSTPVRVNRGRKLTMMIAAEKKIALFTLDEASARVASLLRSRRRGRSGTSPASLRWR